MDNVLLTPHIGGSTEEAQENIGIEVANKLIRYSNNGSTLGGGQFPGGFAAGASRASIACCTSIAISPACCRAINAVFSEEAINIAGQYLQTDAKVGYVVIDVETDERAETVSIRRKLELVPGTIRTRILY